MRSCREPVNEKISVLMGIYNCAPTLREAVASIQSQTYANWELILCDDGSSDDTFAIAQELAKEDNRILLLKNERNLGLNQTLNRCFQASSGSFIARMDGDDLSVPERFEKQLAFLEEHPEFGLVSSPMILFDETGEWGKTTSPEYPTAMQVVSGTPICHAPVMMRRECMEAVNGYTEDPHMLRVEDVNLWIKLYAAGFRAYNLQEPLYKMRNDQNALNRRKYRYRINSTYTRLQGCRLLHLGPTSYLNAFKPMLYGLVPAGLRALYAKRKRTI